MNTQYLQFKDLIKEVDIRNTSGSISDLWGVSIDKKFIRSVANIIGTDLTKYKVVKQNQFVCSLMQVSRDEKIPIDRWNGEAEIIVSPAYKVFEVKDDNIVLPEYLNLWFRRSEFDREASYYGVGGVRGSLEWEDFCEMALPVPLLAEQQEIVDAYNDIERRIALKRKINDNLESQLNTLFKENFANYLTSDELPIGLERHSLLEIAKYLNGLTLQEYSPKNKLSLPVLKIRELRQGYCDSNSDYCSAEIPLDMIIENRTIIFSWSGSLLVDIWCGGKVGLNQHLFKVTSQKYPDWLIYLWTKHYLKEFIRIADGKKTSMGHIRREDLANSLTVVPNSINLSSFSNIFQPIYEMLVVNKEELQELLQVKSILLTQLSR